MSLSFRIVASDLSDDALDELTRRIVRDAADEQIELKQAPGVPESVAGQRGEPITVGALVLALVTSKTIVALFDLLKSCVGQSREFSVEFTGRGGMPVKLSMKNVSLERFQEAVRSFENGDG